MAARAPHRLDGAMARVGHGAAVIVVVVVVVVVVARVARRQPVQLDVARRETEREDGRCGVDGLRE